METLLVKIADQIKWAEDRGVESEKDDDFAAVEAWHGYVQALRWVQWWAKEGSKL